MIHLVSLELFLINLIDILFDDLHVFQDGPHVTLCQRDLAVPVEEFILHAARVLGVDENNATDS